MSASRVNSGKPKQNSLSRSKDQKNALTNGKKEKLMKKIQMFTYEVAPNEQVTVKVTPSVNLGKLYTAVLDTTKLPQPADGVYSFPATNPVGQTHFFGIEFGFTGAPNGAQYVLTIDGDGANNSGPFTVTVFNGDPLLDKHFQFSSGLGSNPHPLRRITQ
jgi:hypothetical protein